MGRYVITAANPVTRNEIGYLDSFDVSADEDLAHAAVFAVTEDELVALLARARREWVDAKDRDGVHRVLTAHPVDELVPHPGYGNGVMRRSVAFGPTIPSQATVQRYVDRILGRRPGQDAQSLRADMLAAYGPDDLGGDWPRELAAAKYVPVKMKETDRYDSVPYPL